MTATYIHWRGSCEETFGRDEMRFDTCSVYYFTSLTQQNTTRSHIPIQLAFRPIHQTLPYIRQISLQYIYLVNASSSIKSKAPQLGFGGVAYVHKNQPRRDKP
jgi:hypothetical protein